MVWLAVVLILIGAVFSWAYRFHLFSFYIYLSVQFEHRGRDYQLLSSLRENLVHERKKKIAGLEIILSGWEKGEEIQPRFEYFEELLEQLKELVRSERRNLMATSEDVWLWGKLWNMLLKIERIFRDKRERSDVPALRMVLVRFNELTDQVLESATQKFSFSLNDAVREAVKTVRVEKTQATGIIVEEELEDAGENVRFSYDNFKQWQRVLTNLIRNAFEAVEAKQSGAGGLGLVAAPLARRGGEESLWVKVSTRESEKEGGQAGMPDLPRISVPVSVIIEDSGIGMDEATRSSFYKKGFTSGKEGGLGLGVSEESVQLINQYGNWQVESQKGVGTKIAINIDREKARKAELILPPKKAFFRRRLALGVSSVILLGIIGLASLFVFDKYSRFWVDWNPISAKVEDKKLLIVYNKKGNEVWRRRFLREISVGTETDAEGNVTLLKRAVKIADVDSDRKNEILVGFLESESETGYLMCLDYKGNELWKFSLGKKGVYAGGGEIYSPSFEIIIEDVDQDKEKEITLSANCKTWYPCQLLVLSKDGKKKGEYWHSGHVAIQFVKDIDGDGKMEIVCGGVNNHLDASPVVFILNGENVNGQSPPHRSKVLPKAKEEVYVKIPRLWGTSSKIGRYPSAGIHYDGEREGYDQYAVIVKDYQKLAREYFVDQNLNLKKGLSFSPTFYDEWAKLRERGLIDFDITPEIIEKWMKFERWENGVKVK